MSAEKRNPGNVATLRQQPEIVHDKQAGESFVPYAPPDPINPDVRIVAFYLPQFHPFPENDAWWGKGFTEWSNVGKARPNYVGHYQPHCPVHVGYYDLRIPSVMEEQAKIAREYGIGGFAFYFYWFSGKVLMQEPLEAMLANPGVDIPFCLTWANENWTRRWDGKDHEVLIGQTHSMEDSRNFLRHVAKYFADPRYIRVGKKPVLLVYKVDIIPGIRDVTDMWRDEARALGFDGLHLIAVQTNIGDPRPYGFDAALQFPPHRFRPRPVTDQFEVTNHEFVGKILNYNDIKELALAVPDPEYRLYRGAMLSWDNTARRQNNPIIFENFSCQAFQEWMTAILKKEKARSDDPVDDRMVFVNAWNEWAEGTHLEPDRKHGFGYLKAVYDALVIANCARVEKETQDLVTSRKS